MSELETKIRNVLKAWKAYNKTKNSVWDKEVPMEPGLFSAVEDAILDLESLLNRPAPTLNTEPSRWDVDSPKADRIAWW